MDGIVEQFFNLLEQVILPNWPDLIALLPWVLIVILILGLVGIAWAWRRTGRRTRSRVPRPLAGGAPPPGVHMPGPSRWPFVAPIGGAILLFSFALPEKSAAGETLAPFNIPLFIIGLIVTIVALAGWLYESMREWQRTAVPEMAEHGALPAGTNAAVALVPAGSAALQRVEVAEPAPAREPPPGVHLPGPSAWPFFAPIAMALMLYGVIFSAALLVGGLFLAFIAMIGWYLEAGREYRTTEEFGHAVPQTRDPVQAWPRRLVPVFVVVIVISFGVALAPIGLGYLNSLTPAEATPTPLRPAAQPEISAQNLVFDTNILVVPANRPFQLVFNNNDPGVPHNVQIDDSPARNETLFDGEVVDGVTTVTYDVPALQPGDYYFLCKIHPNMNGTLKAVAESGGGAPATTAP